LGVIVVWPFQFLKRHPLIVPNYDFVFAQLLSEKQLRRLVHEYVQFFNEDHPHQGINQRIPAQLEASRPGDGEIVVRPVLGGLPHAYHRQAA